jgi:hypothetical protein
MVEVEFQIDMLKIAIRVAQHMNGNSYQRFRVVTSRLGIMEKQYREQRKYTLAMYTGHLLSLLQNTGSAYVALERLERCRSIPPTSNTGVNLAGDCAEDYFMEEIRGM